MFKRELSPHIKKTFFLFGARGTGKTSWLKANLMGANTLYVDLLDREQFRRHSIESHYLEEQIKNNNNLDRVIIDEIQKIPDLLDTVHRMIEDHKNIQFILTGSSSRKLKRDGANLLGGRAQFRSMFPLTFRELGSTFDLHDALSWGTLPELYSMDSKEDKTEYLSAYADIYLREEVMQEGLIRKLEPFQRFLPVAGQMSGKIINSSSIAKDVGVAPKTVDSYFEILTDTLLGFPLKSFTPSIRKQERQSQKYYIFDVGVTRSLAAHTEVSPTPGTSYFGELFEQLVVQEMYRANSYFRSRYEMLYYSSSSGLEVDLVLLKAYIPKIFIEIKSTDFIQTHHIKNLEKLYKEFPEVELYCLSNDPISRKIGNVSCLHWKKGINQILINPETS